MANAISFDDLGYYFNYFGKLKKAGISYEIQKTEEYVQDTSPIGAGHNDPGHAYYAMKLYATFKNVKSLQDLASIWSIAPVPLAIDSIQSFTEFEGILKTQNCMRVNGDLYKKNNPAVKFYAASVFDNNDRVSAYMISDVVPEVAKDGHTIRYVTHGGAYNNGEIVYCADERDKLYNYIDKGHVIIYADTGEQSESGTRVFVTDAVTLDMNYIIAAATIHPPSIDDVLKAGAFLPSKDSRLTLLKVEKEIPAKLRPRYLDLKRRIQEDFSKNTTSVMIGKLTRRETPFIDINGIRITSNRADYTAGHVTIEAPNLAEVVFAKLNPAEIDWDIFSLINIYTDWVNDQFKGLALNNDQTGFAEAKTFTFSINDIPLEVCCSTENTRRSVNGHLINVDELSPVLKRAGCYPVTDDNPTETNVINFNKFITDVSRHSLKIRDIWGNGLPVKSTYLASDAHSHGKPATLKHPKLRFERRDKKGENGFYLLIPQIDLEAKTKAAAKPGAKGDDSAVKKNSYKIGKFAEFVKKVDQLNRSSYMGYSYSYRQTAEGFFIPNSANTQNDCAVGLVRLLGEYADGITEDDKKAIVGVINYELSNAEKLSEELLKEACLLTGSTAGTRDGKKGYVIPGKMRTYFVEEEGSMKVWNNDPKATDPYFCVVNRGDMGVGKDALIARIFALHNDEMMAKQIHTLVRK